MDHDADLHERGVDLPAARVDDVHIVFPHGLRDAHARLADAAFRHLSLAEWDAESMASGEVKRIQHGEDTKGYTVVL